MSLEIESFEDERDFLLYLAGSVPSEVSWNGRSITWEDKEAIQSDIASRIQDWLFSLDEDSPEGMKKSKPCFCPIALFFEFFKI